MAALTFHPLSNLGWPIPLDPSTMPEPQGIEGNQLRAKVCAVLSHWNQRSEFLLASQTNPEDYESVPFLPIQKVRVTYKYVGELKPAPYPLDQ